MKRLMIRGLQFPGSENKGDIQYGVFAALLISGVMYIAYFLIRDIPAFLIDLSYYTGQTSLYQKMTDEIASNIINSYVTAQSSMLISLALSPVLLAVTLIFVKLIQREPLSSIGIMKAKAARKGAYGLGIGIVAAAAGFAAYALSANTAYNGIANLMFLFLPAYALQGVAEEVFFRGFVFSSLSSRTSALPAVMISSAFYAFAHMPDIAMTPQLLFQIFVSGALFAFFTIRTGSVWGAAGLHAGLNFTVGLFYPVSSWSIHTSYAIFGAGGGVILWVAAAETAAILILLFVGKGRLIVPMPEKEALYKSAVSIARKEYAGLRDKEGRLLLRYAIKVSKKAQTWDAKTALVLQKAFEDGKAAAYSLKEKGFGQEVISALEALKRQEGESEYEHHNRIRENPVARAVIYAGNMYSDELRSKSTRRKSTVRAALLDCRILRREIDENQCIRIRSIADGVSAPGEEEGLMLALDYDMCRQCPNRRG